jgi:hypothetical protein
MWIFTVKGTAQALSGNAVITPDGGAKGTLVIDAASFDTGNTKRDDHLRNFFDAETHPALVFEATSARPDSADLEIRGTLTVRGRIRPVTLHAEITGSPDSATVATSIEIDRSLWGITCAPCWAALWPGSRTPALPATRQKRGRIARRPRRVVHASAATTCSSSSAMSFSQPTAGAQIAHSGTTQADGATSHAATHNGGCG